MALEAKQRRMPNTCTVAALSQCELDATLISSLGRVGLCLQHCRDPAQLPDVASKFPQLAVLAIAPWSRPVGSWLYQALWPIPVMVLAREPTTEEVVSALNAGAADYRDERTDPMEIAYRLRSLVRLSGGGAAAVSQNGVRIRAAAASGNF